MADRKEKRRGPLYCRLELRGQSKKQRTNPDYCPDCGLRIRNTIEAHNAGRQHQKIKAHIEKEMRINANKTKTSIYK